MPSIENWVIESRMKVDYQKFESLEPAEVLSRVDELTQSAIQILMTAGINDESNVSRLLAIIQTIDPKELLFFHRALSQIQYKGLLTQDNYDKFLDVVRSNPSSLVLEHLTYELSELFRSVDNEKVYADFLASPSEFIEKRNEYKHDICSSNALATRSSGLSTHPAMFRDTEQQSGLAQVRTYNAK